MIQEISLSETLRKETRKEHTHTEGVMNAKAMFSEQYSLDSYTKHLFHLYKAHCLVNYILTEKKLLIPSENLLPKNRVDDLKKDLLNLNFTDFYQNFCLKDENLFKSLPNLLGLIYVIKGSELGGNIIANQIKKHRIHWKTPSAEFYKGSDSDHLKTSWTNWCNQVNKLADSEKFIEASVTSSKLAFALFANPDAFADFIYA
ncbi:biliverdin-producing heme oxygenase [Polaribacter litorisediminis]|uniref:biliverdin-producing heme oxygenase n=1 Tax=Polaribacter litorisediminis TaxID=1908341 RepID=UPI001CBDA261|nr:biliverdin-producing heme oxygenase [Polaribacter litorisediminis]UAM97926.1 biliverdin-producing heme oxygenase [Polaribacter litorisediminis]